MDETRPVRLRPAPGTVLWALTALIVAGLAARDAAVFALASRNPNLALTLAPASATAIAESFDRTVRTPAALAKDFRGWIAASRQALRADPLNAGALRLLAYVTEQMPSGQNRARELMRLSERASRRDYRAQLWLIEDAVAREDVAGAIAHYDRALSTRPALAGLLIPVLASAASDVAIQTALVPYLKANRPWSAPFLSTAIETSPEPKAIARLILAYGGSRTVAAHSEYDVLMLRKLIDVGALADARRFAVALGAGHAPDVFAFTRATTDERFVPLTWTLYRGSDGEASLGNDGALDIAVRPDARIVAASRVLAAAPRQAVLQQTLTFPDPQAMPILTWKAYCRRKTGPTLFWTYIVPAEQAARPIEAPFDAPDGCAGIQVDLEATGSAGSTFAKASIDSIDLVAR